MLCGDTPVGTPSAKSEKEKETKGAIKDVSYYCLCYAVNFVRLTMELRDF